MGLTWSWRAHPAHPSVPKSQKRPFPQEPPTLPIRGDPTASCSSHSKGRNTPLLLCNLQHQEGLLQPKQGSYPGRNGNYWSRDRARAEASQLLLREPTGVTKSFHPAKKNDLFSFFLLLIVREVCVLPEKHQNVLQQSPPEPPALLSPPNYRNE